MSDERDDDRRHEPRRVEDRVMEHRVASLEKVIATLAPAVGQVAVLEATLEGFGRWLEGESKSRKEGERTLGEGIGALDTRLDDMEKDARSGRRAIIVAVIGATATIIASVVAGYVALKAAGAAP